MWAAFSASGCAAPPRRADWADELRALLAVTE